MNKSTPSTPHVLIIGGGFGGLAVARELANSKVNITIIDKRNHHIFQPLLYQVASAGLSPAEIAYPLRSIFRKRPQVTVLHDRVLSVDLENQIVIRESGSSSFDFLVLAVGARNNYFGKKEWKKHAIGLKDLSDALEIRKRVLLAFEKAELTEDPAIRNSLLNFVIIGGGASGVEMAGALAELANHALARDFRKIDPRDAFINLIEATGGVLPAFSEELREDSLNQLIALGVKVRLNTRVEDITADGVKINNDFINAKTVIWCAGVSASALTETVSTERDKSGRIVVDADMSICGFPNAFAIGDCASFLHQGAKPLPGTATVAIQQGKLVAENIDRTVRSIPRKRFQYSDYGSLATIGRSKAIAEFGKIKLKGAIAWWAWCLVHIFFLIGFRNRFVVMLDWSWQYFSYTRGARVVVEKDLEE